jgi:hypothetical protein
MRGSVTNLRLHPRTLEVHGDQIGKFHLVFDDDN